MLRALMLLDDDGRPGLVYKFKDRSGVKVFVNVVVHKLVKRPLDSSSQVFVAFSLRHVAFHCHCAQTSTAFANQSMLLQINSRDSRRVGITTTLNVEH